MIMPTEIYQCKLRGNEAVERWKQTTGNRRIARENAPKPTHVSAPDWFDLTVSLF